MVKVKTYDLKKNESGEKDIKSVCFQTKANDELIHLVIKGYLYNRWQKTASVRGRSDVAGGGAKPWRQKGTGRARAGTNNSPLWVGGGVIFGPSNQKKNYKLNKKVKRKALLASLSNKVKNIVVLTGDSSFTDSYKKVKDFVPVLKEIGCINDKILYITTEKNNRDQVIGNIQKIKVSSVHGLNVYDVMNSSYVLLEEGSLKQLEEIVKNG